MTREQEHLQLFIYRVHKMRDLQKQYFAGNRSAFNDAKKAEVMVDNAIIKLLSDFAYSLDDVNKLYQQQKLL